MTWRIFLKNQADATLLAPDIIEVAVAGNEPDELSIARLRQGVSARWAEQRLTGPDGE